MLLFNLFCIINDFDNTIDCPIALAPDCTLALEPSANMLLLKTYAAEFPLVLRLL